MERFISITVPFNTPESNPVLTTIPLQKGKIEHCYITFPSGCAGLVHAQLFIHNIQVAPYNPTASLIGNGISIMCIKDYLIDQPPYELSVKAWSLDDTFDHTLLLDIMTDDKVGKTLPELLMELD
jgi:hypothetical protein